MYRRRCRFTSKPPLSSHHSPYQAPHLAVQPFAAQSPSDIPPKPSLSTTAHRPFWLSHQARLGSRPTLSRVAHQFNRLGIHLVTPPAMPLSALSRPPATACRCSQTALLSLAGGARAHLVTRSNPAFLGDNPRPACLAALLDPFHAPATSW